MQAALAPSSSTASALIYAEDNMNNMNNMNKSSSVSAAAPAPPCYQYGENNHIEYKASNSNVSASASASALQEKIMQFYFQLVRTSDASMIQCIAKDTRNILSEIMSGISKSSDVNIASDEYKTYMDMGVIMFKILAHTRDIVSGKGEYMLFYVMLTEWAKIDFQFFDFMIRALVYDATAVNTEYHSHQKHPLGSWKDMKYFLTYMKAELIDSAQPHSQVFKDYKNNQSQCDLYSRCVNTIVLLINE
jgi:Tfp pilus assembly protein PilX